MALHAGPRRGGMDMGTSRVVFFGQPGTARRGTRPDLEENSIVRHLAIARVSAEAPGGWKATGPGRGLPLPRALHCPPRRVRHRGQAA